MLNNYLRFYVRSNNTCSFKNRKQVIITKEGPPKTRPLGAGIVGDKVEKSEQKSSGHYKGRGLAKVFSAAIGSTAACLQTIHI